MVALHSNAGFLDETSMPSTYYEMVENEVVFRRSQLMCLHRA